MSVEEGKFVRMFGRSEIRLTACAVTKNVDTGFLLGQNRATDYFVEPNQFWTRDRNHERASIKVYRKRVCDHSLFNDTTQTVKIPMPFLGSDSDDGYGELQFLIKAPRLVKLARHRSFDTRVNEWVEETEVIQSKTEFRDHSYLALRFYHQDHLPQVPDNWHWEPVYVSVMYHRGPSSPFAHDAVGPFWEFCFYRIWVFWEKDEIEITVNTISGDSSEIPKHLK